MPRHQQEGRKAGGWVGVLEGGDGETALAGSLWRCYPAQRRGVTSLSPTPSKSQNWTLILLLHIDSLNRLYLIANMTPVLSAKGCVFAVASFWLSNCVASVIIQNQSHLEQEVKEKIPLKQAT